MYKIAICDDDLEYAKYLEEQIIAINEQKQKLSIQLFQSGQELIDAMDDEIMLVILDMEMEGLDGYETAKILRETNDKFILAFCTGIVKPEARYYDLKVLRYIMKDDPENLIVERLKSLLNEIEKREEMRAVYFFGQGKGTFLRFDVDDIIYFEHYQRKTMMI